MKHSLVNRLLASRNPFVRKGASVLLRNGAELAVKSYPGIFGVAAPVLVNSIPKSGTHLLTQVVSALPSVQQRGRFLASTPSISVFQRSPERLAREITRLTPGEMVPAHLHYSPDIEQALAARRVMHCFIYRDPRDIVISEAHYLTHMNRWHRLHKLFVAAGSFEDRVALAITGATDSRGVKYPDIGSRIRQYLPWLNAENCLSVRFEDLRAQDERLQAVVSDICSYYLECNGETLDLGRLTDAAMAEIDPSRSHTFRSSGARGWQSVFTPRLNELFSIHGAGAVEALGYK